MDTQEPAIYGAVNYDIQGKPRIGDWIQTYTKKRFHLLDPRPEDFDIKDIAHALANICRFAGHVRKFYSVAEHSVRVAEYTQNSFPEGQLHLWIHGCVNAKQMAFAALMHDAPEAYICDVARPFKHLPEFAFYREIEAKLEQQIAVALGVVYPLPYHIKIADEILLGTEARDLMSPCIDGWRFRYRRLPNRIRPWSPRKAERRFLDMYYKLNPFGIRKPSRFLLGPNFLWRAA